LVIAVGSVWFFAQYSEHQRVQKCIGAGASPGAG